VLVSTRDENAIARFIERMALVLTDAGMARMPSRVFTYLLATDEGKATAGQLADGLGVSPAAVSGAVRYLDQVGLVVRARDPGERRDHYEVADDLWYEVYGNRDKQFDQWAGVLMDGIAAVGPESPAGQRLDQTRRFIEFLREQMPLMMQKWRAQEAALTKKRQVP
jgi:DNA-binding transcriptional regulator GbsR (MarR family)